MVNLKNYEEYMLLDADGELNEKETAALHDFLLSYPELEREYILLKATVSQSLPSLVYEKKEQLLKTNVTPLLGNWWLYGAAASLVLLLALLFTLNHKDDAQQIVKIEPKQPVEKNFTIPSTNDIHSMPVKPVTIKTIEAYKPNIAKAKPLHDAPVIKERLPATQELLELTPNADLATNIAMLEPELQPVPQQVPVIPNIEPVTNNKDVFALLGREKPEGISDISNTVSEKIHKARSIAKAVASADLVVRFGDHDLLNVQF